MSVFYKTYFSSENPLKIFSGWLRIFLKSQMQRVNIGDFLFSCYNTAFKGPTNIFRLYTEHESPLVPICFSRTVLQISLRMPVLTHTNSYREILQHIKVCLFKPCRGNLLQLPYLFALSLLNKRQSHIECSYEMYASKNCCFDPFSPTQLPTLAYLSSL